MARRWEPPGLPALWNEDLSALEFFWSGTYPNERGFQLYHDLQFDSELTGFNYSSFLLQRETLAMIAGQGRLDFEAMAHFRMAETAGWLGNLEEEKNELESYKKVLEQLPDHSDAKLLYTAYCDIGAARLAMHSGDQVQANTILKAAEEGLESRDNLALKLEYMTSRADLARIGSDPSAEEAFLRRIIGIGENQAEKLKLSSDRWHWLQLLDRSHRRLLEVILAKPHIATQTFAFWHQWRLLQTAQEAETGKDSIRNLLHDLHSGRMISFAVLSHSIVVWVVNSREVHEYLLPVDADAVREEARIFYQLCSDPNSNIEKVNASGSRLYQMLIAPLEQELGKGGHLVVEADSYLNLVPWAALRIQSGHYWGEMESFTLRTGFSRRRVNMYAIKPLQRMLIATPGSTTVDGITYLPVFKAQEEGAVVESFFPRASRLLPGQSSASRLRAELKRAEGLHFVGHAITRQEGGELITDEDGKAPFLTAGMLRNTDMPKLQLVVLSACSTASPEGSAEGDPGGLVQAFVAAGVPTVVASRWDVDSSSTAELMTAFYQQMAATGQPEKALALASRSLIAGIRFRHPYYWSAFQVFSSN